MPVTRFAALAAALLCSTTVPASNPHWDGFSGTIAPPPASLAPARATVEAAAPPRPVELPTGDPTAIFSLDAPVGPPTGSISEAEPPAEPAGVDDRALRFYASRNEMARVAAEIRRIRAAHPDWEPPTDLFEPGRDDELERPLWALLDAGRFVEIRRAVARVREERPNWRPSNAFAAQYEERVARATIAAAAEASDHRRVVEAARAAPSILACSNMDLLWHVGEALARTGDATRAESLYAFVLETCPDRHERVATLQKAAAFLDGPAVDRLAAVAARHDQQTAAFDEAVYGIVMGRVGEVIAAPAGRAAAPDDLRRLEELALQRRDGAGMEVLGWYRQVVETDYEGAARAFRDAMSFSRSPKAAEGYALALREAGRLREAEDVAYEWRDADPLIEKLYVEIVADQITRPDLVDFPLQRLQRFEALVLSNGSPNGAQAVGWFYYKSDDVEEAQRWFRIAHESEPDPVNTFGLALTAHELDDGPTVRALAREFGERFPQVAAVATWTSPTSTQPRTRSAAPRAASRNQGSGTTAQAVALYEVGDYRGALRALDSAPSAVARDHGLQVLRGWALYNAGRYEEARRQFERTHAERPTRDTLYGMHHAQVRQLPTE